MYSEIAAGGCLIWYFGFPVVAILGVVHIFLYYTRLPPPPVSSSLDHDSVPHVTIIRPCKGLEPYLYECLAATCYQDYPGNKLTVHFCVASKNDPAFPILQRLLSDYKHVDLRIFVEEEDPHLYGGNGVDIGPNPKIRNMSRAYREAKGDIIWIMDCNVWMNRGACGRMVDKLCGFEPKGQKQRNPYKLVAHLPICVSVDGLGYNGRSAFETSISGGLLEQAFLSTAHGKMYVAINTVAIAPCINGKSTAFRRSHLDHITHGKGIDQFGQNICEDHLIGDLLWKTSISPTPEIISSDPTVQSELRKSNPLGLRYKNHGIAFHDLAIQPVANMSLSAYVARRVRWLRVRKFTVPAATLVEPGTECFFWAGLGAYGLTASSYTKDMVGTSWSTSFAIWIFSVVSWCIVDYFIFGVLQGGESIGPLTESEDQYDQKENKSKPVYSAALPAFVKPPRPSSRWKNSSWLPFSAWLTAWLGRESLALAIWTWAIWGGTTVTWRDRHFWVGIDMKVHEIAKR